MVELGFKQRADWFPGPGPQALPHLPAQPCPRKQLLGVLSLGTTLPWPPAGLLPCLSHITASLSNQKDLDWRQRPGGWPLSSDSELPWLVLSLFLMSLTGPLPSAALMRTTSVVLLLLKSSCCYSFNKHSLRASMSEILGRSRTKEQTKNTPSGVHRLMAEAEMRPPSFLFL